MQPPRLYRLPSRVVRQGSFEYLLGEEQTYLQLPYARMYPASLVINTNGEIVFAGFGEPDFQLLREVISILLGQPKE